MPMEIDRKELKRRAREAMAQVKPSFWIVTLVYILMTTGVSCLADFAPGMLATFLSIALTMYGWVVGFSYRLWSLWTARRLDPDLGALMDGFSVAGRVILLELSILVRTFGWCLLLILPISMLFSGAAMFATDMTLALAAYVGMLVVVVIVVNIIVLRYSLSYYVLADYPDLGPAVALAHSVRLTRGWIWELFKLHLSFAGWYILSAVLSTVGIAVGMLAGGDLSALTAVNPGDIMGSLSAVEITFTASVLANLISLPVTLYFTPYLEVTLAQFYDARIRLGDNMADPMGGMQMPPL